MVAGLEVQREAGKYMDPNSLVVFPGLRQPLPQETFGLVSCCKGAGSSGSLFSNLNMIMGAGSGRPACSVGQATPTTPCSPPMRRIW